MKKYIKSSTLMFVLEPYDDPIMMNCDLDFVMGLNTGDIIWIADDVTPSDTPYLDITQEQIDKLSGNGHVVMFRDIINDRFNAKLLSLSNDYGIREQFKHLSF